MTIIKISKDLSGRIKITFPYNPSLVEKVKTLKGRRWHKDRRYWSLPDSDGVIGQILSAFKGEDLHIDPALKGNRIIPSPPVGEGQGEGGFEDLRRELLSRKYSYKTVKGYLYYNRDFLNFANKTSADITDNDIKDYLLYLAEEEQSAPSTLNQAINALKFYYGMMLKKKFVYEVKRPRKDVTCCLKQRRGCKNPLSG